MEFDALVKGGGVIVHLGSHLGHGWEAVKKQLVTTIKQILKSTPKQSSLLIENSAGQKGKVCSDLAEVHWLLNQIKSPRLGWCVDTCHAYSAGMRLVPNKYSGKEESHNGDKKNYSDLISEIDKYSLWKSLKCVHINDNKDDFDSGRDRHQNIGEGTIPAAELKAFVNNRKIKGLPLLIEVPGIEGKGPDAENIKRVRKLLKS